MGLDLVVDDPQREVVAVVFTEHLDVVGDHPEGVAGGPVALRQLRQRVSAGVRAPGDLPERRIAAERLQKSCWPPSRSCCSQVASWAAWPQSA